MIKLVDLEYPRSADGPIDGADVWREVAFVPAWQDDEAS